MKLTRCQSTVNNRVAHMPFLCKSEIFNVSLFLRSSFSSAASLCGLWIKQLILGSRATRFGLFLFVEQKASRVTRDSTNCKQVCIVFFPIGFKRRSFWENNESFPTAAIVASGETNYWGQNKEETAWSVALAWRDLLIMSTPSKRDHIF